MNPEFGLGYSPQNPGMGNVGPPSSSPSISAIQSSTVLIVTKLQGGAHGHAPAPAPMNMASMPYAQVAPGAMPAPAMGWSAGPQQQMQMPMPGSAPAAFGAPFSSVGSPLSQYSILNQQNAEIARIEPSVPPAQGFTLRGSAGDNILAFALEMTQSSNTPMLLIRNVEQMGSRTVIGSLTAEFKQPKEGKHKDKPKKDKKKDKDDHKDKSKDKGSKRVYVLRNHLAQPMLSFSSKQKSKEGSRFELKIKSLGDKDEVGGEVESLGSSAATSGFQIKFKSHKHGSSHIQTTDPYSAYQKCFILASVVGITELFKPAQL